MAGGLSVIDYSYYRYLGQDTMISNGIRMQPREVVGLVNTGNVYYIAHPKYPRAVAISNEDGDMIVKQSRQFTAKPNALFPPSFDFTPVEATAEQKPKAPPIKPATPEPKGVPANRPTSNGPILRRPTEEEMQPKLPKELLDMPDMDAAARRAAAWQMMNSEPHDGIEPLVYANAVYPGGTENNYAVKSLEPCGKIHLEIKGIDEFSIPRRRVEDIGFNPPQYVLDDIQNNVMAAVGMNIQLPFKRLYVGLSTASGHQTSIATYMASGIMYGVIVLQAKQLIGLFGGFNSKSVAHAMTHELAHFVDHTMIRNVEKMRFDQAIRGKSIHPDLRKRGAASSVPAEHFATLAELMVWGWSARNVYALNGFEIVAKYFENRYIPESDITSRKL